METTVHLKAHNIQRPSQDIEARWARITQEIPNFSARSACILLARIYELFWSEEPQISIFFDSDSMGGLEVHFQLEGLGALTWKYEQSLRESWSSIECLTSEGTFQAPAGSRFSFRLNLVGWGTWESTLEAPQGLHHALKDLLNQHFETLEELP